MSGRSRGRARVRTDPKIQLPGQEADKEAKPVPVPAPKVVPTSKPIVPESGRGRGLSAEQTTIAPTAAKAKSSSEESPPQQISPPHSQSSGSGITTHSVGRAALRGAPHQPGVAVRTELLPPMERLQLQDTGDIKATQEKPEIRYESVLYTKPASCTDKTGTAGLPVKILCNYFEVTNKPDWVLHQYHVDFAPVIDSRSLRIGLMKNHNDLFPLNKAFDGSTLYSLTKLHDEITEVASTRESDKQIIQIKIKRVGEIVPTSPQFVHLFNLVFRRCLKLYGMQEIDRCFFDMKTKTEIKKYNLFLISGMATSISVYEHKLLLCAELAHKLLHKDTIHDMMSKIYNEVRSEGEFKEKCTSEIVGRTIMTPYNNKSYKIDDIDWNSNPKSVFKTKLGDVSFMDYYKKNYDLKINDPQQPLLISLPSGKDKRRAEQMGVEAKPALLVPELCIITGVSESMRTDFRFKKELEQFSKFDANERCQKLSQFVSNFKTNENVITELNKWQMNFETKPCELTGRVLPPESLMFGNNVVKQISPQADWTNDLKNAKLLNTINLSNWIIVFPSSKKSAACSFVETYMNVIGSMGIKAHPPYRVEVSNDMPDQLVNCLKQNIKDDTQMVVCVVSNKRKDRYDAIKKICCLEKPVPSQVCTAQIIDDIKKRMSVVTKIAIQMNCKLGGELWMSNIPMKRTMICGIDTYHDSAKKHGSVCAFIATCNDKYTRYFSRATLQETHQELSSNLSITVKSACEQFKKVNNFYPEKIIIYRDGVGDGQLSMVKEHEIPQIERAFSMIDSGYTPHLSVIIVKKRGNSRFFAANGNKLANPPYGTIIDTVVTRAEWQDFYLISQYVRQGTVNPTHYNVIHDTSVLKTDHFQKLTFKLTHMYYNWPGTIRVPSVCQYAHKLAFLVGQSLHKEHHASLCDKLFYL